MARQLAIFALGFFGIFPAFAASISERPESVTVTIYHEGQVDTAEFSRLGETELLRDGLAFITETRTVDLPAGPAEIEFRDVTSTMVPQTADIQGLPVGVLERNFDYNLLSPGSLLAKSIGETVRLVRIDPKTGKLTEQTAIVRSAPGGAVLEIDGHLEALHCSGLPEKLVFEKTPDGLRDTPTLSIRTNAAAARRYTVKLSYIATGLNWSADYIARIRPDGRSLDLTGWITLANFSATGFEQSPVEVVAGELATTGQDEPVVARPPALITGCWPTDIDWASHRRALAGLADMVPPPPPPPPPPAPMGELQEVVVTGSRVPAGRLGDYKIYRLPEVTDVAARQTKQVQFLDQVAVPFERVYTYSVDSLGEASQVMPATVLLRLLNTTSAGLGEPLPAGAVSVMEPASDGSPVLIGQARVRDIAVGLPLEMETGRAMDVRVERRVTESQTIGSGKSKRTRLTYEIAIENDKTIPIRFELAYRMLDGAQIVAEDTPHVVTPRGAIWSLALKPGQRQTVRYTIDQPGS